MVLYLCILNDFYPVYQLYYMIFIDILIPRVFPCRGSSKVKCRFSLLTFSFDLFQFSHIWSRVFSFKQSICSITWKGLTALCIKCYKFSFEFHALNFICIIYDAVLYLYSCCLCSLPIQCCKSVGLNLYWCAVYLQ